ncbi:MAG: hypothetical protein PWQ61_1300 [Betaproteobacteria bacterium]|nr:hypothetical protein [Betaproteobacteria bacterium]
MTDSSRLHRVLSAGALVTGLAVVAWVASGFVGSSAFALGMTLLIGAVFLGGVWELRRYSQATAALQTAMADVPQPLERLSDWLTRVPDSLQGAVRQRVEGDRVAFPALTLTPYLIGLLVMLGMLGTFLGMVVTFKGAVFALEGSADLSAIRSALAAPIKGLGLSFGTSVAGVATSAMLGLMTTLARRERTRALRMLDGLVATTLRPFSAAHQRQQSFEALQRQAEAMPAAARHLQTLIEQMEQRSRQLDEQLLARQAEFQREAATAYTGLAQSVERSLRESLAASARAATESLQPVVQQAMSSVAAESLRLHEGVGAAVQAQLSGLSERFAVTTTAVTETWTQALKQHADDARQLLALQEQSLTQLHAGFESRAEQWLHKVQTAQEQAQAQRLQMDQSQQASLMAALERVTQSLQAGWQQAGSLAQTQQQAMMQALEETARAITERSTRQLDQGLEGISRLLAQTEALVQARAASEAAWVQQHGQRMDELAALWRQELSALRETEVQHQQRLVEQQGTWQATIGQQLQALRNDEAVRGDAAVHRLAELQAALATQLATLGNALEAPMARLMQTASEAPKAAAEVIAQLREQMSRLAERDNATLVERADLVGQMGQLLQQVQQTTAEQRAAIENLVGSASSVLERVGQQFADTVGAQSGRAEAMAEQAAASAAQLGALGEAFQAGTGQLAASHEKLVQGLRRVEEAIGQSLTRSDEQLAYYVAQAREVIDLSISAQQGIVEDLRRLRGPVKATAGAA